MIVWILRMLMLSNNMHNYCAGNTYALDAAQSMVIDYAVALSQGSECFDTAFYNMANR